jgi:hypothetical protein
VNVMMIANRTALGLFGIIWLLLEFQFCVKMAHLYAECKRNFVVFVAISRYLKIINYLRVGLRPTPTVVGEGLRPSLVDFHFCHQVVGVRPRKPTLVIP